MKPDGTYTVDELLQICTDQLQSWERKELSEMLYPDLIKESIREMSISEIEDLTGYYVYDEEQEDIDNFSTEDLIERLDNRLSWESIREDDHNKLINMAKNAKIWHRKAMF